MADDDHTHFRFDFGGITLELEGKRPFVERMYRRVMQDVVEARRQTEGEEKSSPSKKLLEKKPSVWVHRCSDMMRKIYMVSRADIGESALGEFTDVEAIGNVYIQKGLLADFFPEIKDGQTLWAEFTPVGRKKIEEATRPSRRALDLAKSDMKS